MYSFPMGMWELGVLIAYLFLVNFLNIPVCFQQLRLYVWTCSDTKSCATHSFSQVYQGLQNTRAIF